METNYRLTDLIKIFDIKETKQTLINQEEKGLIPKAGRVEKGRVSHRVWSPDKLPLIGEKFGFLSKNKSTKVITSFVQKGGNLKSSLVFNMSRMLALHNIKVLCVGLDSQMSLTVLLNQSETTVEDLNHIKKEKGLYHFLFEGAPIEEVIKNTDLPSLNYIPETVELALLDKKLRTERRKEYIFKDRLTEVFSKYDVIMFDCSPNWNSLIEACLTATDILITPIECGVGGYQVLNYNLENVREFQEAMSVEFEEVFLLPTLLEKNKISTQILGSYLQNYSEIIVPHSIRRAVAGQEVGFLKQSITEYQPTSPLAQDYKDAVTFMWNKILANERAN